MFKFPLQNYTVLLYRTSVHCERGSLAAPTIYRSNQTNLILKCEYYLYSVSTAHLATIQQSSHLFTSFSTEASVNHLTAVWAFVWGLPTSPVAPSTICKVITEQQHGAPTVSFRRALHLPGSTSSMSDVKHLKITFLITAQSCNSRSKRKVRLSATHTGESMTEKRAVPLRSLLVLSTVCPRRVRKHVNGYCRRRVLLQRPAPLMTAAASLCPRTPVL